MNVIARLEYELAYYDSAVIALTITPRGHPLDNRTRALVQYSIWYLMRVFDIFKLTWNKTTLNTIFNHPANHFIYHQYIRKNMVASFQCIIQAIPWLAKNMLSPVALLVSSIYCTFRFLKNWYNFHRLILSLSRVFSVGLVGTFQSHDYLLFFFITILLVMRLVQ